MSRLLKLFVNALLFFSFLAASAQCGFSGLSAQYCSNASAVALTPSVQGGVFSGPGIVGSSFIPAMAGSGTHSVSYSYCSGNYSLQNEPFSLPSYNPVYVSLGDNAVAGPFPIGFNFRYFCSTYSQFYISSNGFITFTPPLSSGCCQGMALPTGPSHNEMIAVAWTDLDPSQGGSVRYVLLGAPPSRTLLVSFNCIFHKNGLDPVTAEIMLLEGSDDIVFSTTIKPVTTGTVTYNTTMGLQGPNGNVVTVPGRNGTAAWMASQEQLRFSAAPLCVSAQTVQVIDPPLLSASATPSAVCAGETVVVTASGAAAYSWTPGNVVYASYAVAPAATTVYTITGSIGACSASTTLQVNVGTCTNLAGESLAAPEITAFFDPFTQTIRVKYRGGTDFGLLDGVGRLIRTFSCPGPEECSLSVPAPAPGLYYLRALYGGAAFSVKVLVSE